MAMSLSETAEQRPQTPGEAKPALQAVPWTINDVFRGVVAVVALAVVVLSAIALWGRQLPVKGESGGTLLALSATLVLEILMLVVVWRLAVHKYRVRWRALGFRWLGGSSDFVAAWLVTGAGLLVSIVYGAVVNWLKLDMLKSPPLPPMFSIIGWPWVFGAMLVLVAAPVAEEVFFRGFLFAGIARRYGFWWGAGISALLFSLGHGVLGALIPVFALGLMLAWLYVRTRSLWSCILAHFLYNGLILAIAV